MKGQYASIPRYMFQRLNLIELFKFKTKCFYTNLFKSNFHSKKNENEAFNFEEWFVGLIDGDGTFNVYINLKENKINFNDK